MFKKKMIKKLAMLKTCSGMYSVEGWIENLFCGRIHKYLTVRPWEYVSDFVLFLAFSWVFTDA